MRNVDHPALLADRLRRIEMTETHRDPLGEEQPDDLTGGRAKFLADDDAAVHPIAEFERPRRPHCGR